MVRTKVSPWFGRAAAVGAVLAIGVALLVAWLASNGVRSRLLDPASAPAGADVTVIEVGGGRIVLERTPETDQEGVWGIESGLAYAQVDTITGITDDRVERNYRPIVGEIVAGDVVRFDRDAYPLDPRVAHGLPFEEVRVAGDLGANPAWLIEGRRTTWMVLVHGRGNDRLEESLRLVPTLVEQGYPVLVISYRNDEGASVSRSGLRMWGLDEWPDLDAAFTLAERKGAVDYVLFGHGYGAQVVSSFLHEADRVEHVRGVVFDSPVLDLERSAGAPGGPGPYAWLAREASRIRFGLEWDLLDQVDRADQFDLPVLILHGGRDEVSPIAVSDDFVAARPDIAQIVRFARAGHGSTWNSDPGRYEAAVVEFLDRIIDDG